MSPFRMGVKWCIVYNLPITKACRATVWLAAPEADSSQWEWGVTQKDQCRGSSIICLLNGTAQKAAENKPMQSLNTNESSGCTWGKGKWGQCDTMMEPIYAVIYSKEMCQIQIFIRNDIVHQLVCHRLSDSFFCVVTALYMSLIPLVGLSVF